MKVKELIEGLKTCDPNALVLIASSNRELNGARVDVRGFHTEKVIRHTERFRDMMDYSGYHAEVYRTDDGGQSAIQFY